jgi:hypothetical protein
MMTTNPSVDVTLSADLLRHLRAEARELGVPLHWLIASMIVDTVETIEKSPAPVAA